MLVKPPNPVEARSFPLTEKVLDNYIILCYTVNNPYNAPTLNGDRKCRDTLRGYFVPVPPLGGGVIGRTISASAPYWYVSKRRFVCIPRNGVFFVKRRVARGEVMSEFPYLKLSLDWDVGTSLLTDEEKGRLIDAVLRYDKGEEHADDRLIGNEVYVYPVFCVLIDREKARASKHPGVPSKERHWNWKGGITPENQKERGSWRYSQWRKAVFQRDNYTCQKCGKRGGELNAHHKKPWAKFPALRYEVENGVTLCKKCHMEEHSSRK